MIGLGSFWTWEVIDESWFKLLGWGTGIGTDRKGITGRKDFNFFLLSVVDSLFFFNVCPPPMTEPHDSSASCKLHLKVSSKVPMSQASPEPTLPSCVYIHMALTEGEAEWPRASSFLIDRSVSSTEMWVPWGQGLDPIYLISWVWQRLEQATQHTLFYQASVICFLA